MILGIDHVALSCRNVRVAAAILERAGFRTLFSAIDLPNTVAKKPLLREYRPTHSLAYCRPAQGIAIELTAHGQPVPEKPSPYRVVFNRPPADGAANPTTDAMAMCQCDSEGEEPPHVVRWEPFAVDIHCHCRHHESLAVSALVLPVRDLDASIHFWCRAMGFRDQGQAPSGPIRRLDFCGPVPAWNATLILTAGGVPDRPCLDDVGFPCLALLANHLDESVQAAVAAGAHDVTPPFTVAVGGKQLQVAMFRGPDDELVELIEFQR